jgi:hypothetical protein
MKVNKSNWKVQRLMVELWQTIIPTRVPNPYSKREGEDIVWSTKETCRSIG